MCKPVRRKVWPGCHQCLRTSQAGFRSADRARWDPLKSAIYSEIFFPSFNDNQIHPSLPLRMNHSDKVIGIVPISKALTVNHYDNAYYKKTKARNLLNLDDTSSSCWADSNIREKERHFQHILNSSFVSSHKCASIRSSFQAWLLLELKNTAQHQYRPP